MTCLSTLLECLSMLLISKSYANKSLRPRLLELLIVILDIAVVDYLIPSKQILVVLFGQIICLTLCSLSEDNLMNKFYLFALTFITILIIQIFTSLFIALMANFITTPKYIELIANSLTLVFGFLAMKTPAKKIFHSIVSTGFAYKIALTYSYFYVFSVLLICKFDMDFLYSNVYLFIIVMVLLIISNLILLYYEKIIVSKDQSIVNYQKNLPIYEDLINDIRASQHEFTNRMQSLQILCETSDDLNDIKHKLTEYTKSYSKPLHAYPLLQVNMPLFAASLYSLSLKAESIGITVNFDVVSYNLESKVMETLLADLSSILLQNAIDASKPDDHIYVHVSSKDSKTSVEVRNPVNRMINPMEISDFFTYKYTTKSHSETTDNFHGYGLYYLKKEIIKHNGQIYATCTEYEDKFWMIFKITI